MPVVVLLILERRHSRISEKQVTKEAAVTISLLLLTALFLNRVHSRAAGARTCTRVCTQKQLRSSLWDLSMRLFSDTSVPLSLSLSLSLSLQTRLSVLERRASHLSHLVCPVYPRSDVPLSLRVTPRAHTATGRYVCMGIQSLSMYPTWKVESLSAIWGNLYPFPRSPGQKVSVPFSSFSSVPVRLLN